MRRQRRLFFSMIGGLALVGGVTGGVVAALAGNHDRASLGTRRPDGRWALPSSSAEPASP
jgi:hypothetical protein